MSVCFLLPVAEFGGRASISPSKEILKNSGGGASPLSETASSELKQHITI